VTPHEWTRVLASLPDEDRPCTLRAMADESWITDEDAAWLRGASDLLLPVKGSSWDDEDERRYWVEEGHGGKNEQDGQIPSPLIDVIGRVNCSDVPRADGEYTLYRSAEGAWLDLLLALQKRSRG
jgi:hypothetical protein